MRGSIAVEHLGKQFRRYHPHRPWTLQEAAIGGMRRLFPQEHYWVLRDISFSVEPGRIVGVIGRNGAGKSTLLRIAAGILKPEEGAVKIWGRLGAVLELGAGFHPDLTGRENLMVAGIVGGSTRREVESQIDTIMEFAEIEEYIDNPLHTYSDGMRMRLAFSLAIHLDPDVFLIDEVLAVGDVAFQLKCIRRVMEAREKGSAILLATHDLSGTRALCDEVLWLEGARLAGSGDPNEVVDRYLESMQVGKVVEA
jgi:homopolymeric O-antigen transport system ATP-binding protein